MTSRYQIDTYPEYPNSAPPLTIGDVETGTPAAASITGTAPNQVLNLTIPAGPAGPPADTTALNAAVASASASASSASASASTANSVLAVRVDAPQGFSSSQRLQAQQNVSPAPYLGQVATRCYIPQSWQTNNSQMCRSKHITRSGFTSVQIVYPNWAVGTTTSLVEQGATNTDISVKASFEYPAGTIIPLTFSGGSTGTAIKGMNLISDPISVSVPKGSRFYIRTYASKVAGGLGLPVLAAGAGRLTAVSEGEAYASPGSDMTLSGTITDDGSGSMYFPVAIIAQTTDATVLCVGDSILLGNVVQVQVDGDTGAIPQSIGGMINYINAGTAGDYMSAFNASGTRRSALAAYCSHIVSNYGTNDVFGANRTLAQMITDSSALWGNANFSGKKIAHCTFQSQTSSTDGWVTTANQTRLANYTIANAWNEYLRSTPSPLWRHYDLAGVFEGYRGGTIWIGLPGYVGTSMTSDGIHPNIFGYSVLRTSGTIRPSDFTRNPFA